MKKKLLVVLMVLAMMSTLLAGCGSTSSDSSSSSAGGSSDTQATDDTASTDTSSSDTEDTSEEETSYKIAMILDSSVSDGGWGAACYNAMLEAADVEGFETQYTENVANADFASTMRSYADLGFDMIFAPGNQYSDAVSEVAADYPDVKFALLNGTLETDNITSLLPNAQEIGYMAGALAGLMTQTNSIGFVGGMELDTTKQKLEYYEAGAKAVNPDVEVQSAYAGSFSDTAKGKEIAESMISMNDVDVMFGDASAVDSGVREVLDGYDDKYDIGQPSDILATQESASVISSVVTDNATMLELCMDDLKEGTYGNKTIYGDLSNGALSVGTFSDKVSSDIQDQYMDIVAEIEAGTFVEE